MDASPAFHERVVRDIVPVAHRVLRELDAEDVPPAVRRVAASERLPPPLARSLIKELDRNEWLRAKVVEAWDEADVTSEGVDLFLRRPDGWQSRLESLAESEQAADLEASRRDLQQRVERLESELTSARQKAKSAEKRERQARQEAEQQKKRSRISPPPDDDRTVELERQVASGRDELESLRLRLEDLRLRNRVLRAELLRARRAGTTSQPVTETSAWSLKDPLALARHLDELAESSGAAPGEMTAPQPPTPLVQSPPPGVAPDAPEMLDWILARQGAQTMLVDGYNVTFQLDPSGFHTGDARRRLNESLANLRRRAAGSLRVVVVYDSDQEEAGQSKGPGGVEVRFTDPEVLADQEILALVGGTPGPVIVVTSDRAVREQAEARGALGLWSQALAGWITRSRA